MKGYKDCTYCKGDGSLGRLVGGVERVRWGASGKNIPCPLCLKKRYKKKIKKLKREVKRINIMYDDDMGIAND